MMEWITVSELPETPVFGERQGAEILVQVFIEDDDTKQYYWECLCAACDTIDNIGLPDAVEGNELDEGIHYLKHHVEEYRGIPGRSATEYDVWLVHTDEEERP